MKTPLWLLFCIQHNLDKISFFLILAFWVLGQASGVSTVEATFSFALFDHNTASIVANNIFLIFIETINSFVWQKAGGKRSTTYSTESNPNSLKRSFSLSTKQKGSTFAFCPSVLGVLPFLLLTNVFAQSYNVYRLAGSGDSGYMDGTGINAKFSYPRGVAIDSSGTLFVADTHNHRIRKITSDGVVTTFAGSGAYGFLDGNGTSAKFIFPSAVAVVSSGTLFVADSQNHRIRKITSDGVVTTFAGSGVAGFSDGNSTSAQFYYPEELTVDSNGTLFVADSGNNHIRKITSDGVVTTLNVTVGGYINGNGTNVKFYRPPAITVDSTGTLFVADYYNHRIRKITSDGIVSTFAGSGDAGYLDGIGINAKFNHPTGIAVDSSGTLFVNDYNNYRIRKITSDGVVTTFAGSGVGGFLDGDATSAQFYFPTGIAVDSSGTLFVSEYFNHRIRMITTASFTSGTNYSAQPGLLAGVFVALSMLFL